LVSHVNRSEHQIVDTSGIQSLAAHYT
jgi:hypothetical protein